MNRMLIAASLLALSVDYGHCQSFEVASITPCKPGTPEPPMEHTGLVQFTQPGGRFKASATTVKVLLEWAYGIQPSQHAGGPSWIDTDRYDIVAKAEGNASDNEMKRMTQALLAERFKLKFHRETRTIQAYVLSQGKAAPKLFPPKPDETHALRFAQQTGPDQKVAAFRIIGTRYSIADLADAFARQLGAVIVDKTGLKGEFDFTMDLAPDETRPNPVDATLLLSALKEQLGLTVKSEKTPVEIMVIDGAEKVAAGN